MGVTTWKGSYSTWHAEFCHMQRRDVCKGVISVFIHALAARKIASSCAACCLDYVEDMHMHSQQQHWTESL